MRVGLLEDDLAIQEMLLLVLEDEGHTVINFPSAEACLDALGVSAQLLVPLPVDVMLIDWRLSGITTGTEVIHQIRSQTNLQTLPIILTTAATFHDTTILQNLQVTLLEKPFAVDDVISLIQIVTQLPLSPLPFTPDNEYPLF